MSIGAVQHVKLFQSLARSLVENGVDTIFGLMGDANLYMVDSFVRDQEGRFIASANEAGATLMALGYASVSGKVGVATVTHGPALTNTITALVEGVKGSIPMVLLCGDTPVLQKDNLQNVAQRDLIIASGAGFEQVRAPETATEDMASAFRRAWHERRPVVLNMPSEFQWIEVEHRSVRLRRPETRAFIPTGPDLDDAIGILAAAKRPVVLAGRGAADPASRDALVRLATRIDAPLATTLKAKGLFAGEEFDLGVFGTLSPSATVDIITASDCVIAFGASLNKFTTSNGAFLRGKRVIQCNLEPGDIGRYHEPDVGLVGDPASTAAAIVGWLDEADIPASQFRDGSMAAQIRRSAPVQDAASESRAGDTVDFRHALRRLNEALPADRILVTDGGRFLSEAWKILDVGDPQSFVTTVNFGSIGLGLAEAIGAGVAAGGRPVVLITGDGGFMLGGLVEFNTAVRHGIDLIVVVCNDSGYGAEYIQFQNKNMDPSLSLLDWPDFGPVATSLGGTGFTVRNTADLETALAAIHNRNRPVLLDLKLDPDAVPPPAYY
ncbi:MAG: thiamine pyrophosphate-dependent enzyme possible carboligase or decarboxylase [Enterovirga sp.]|nr:thiamine pyrophosphate-dependent enzyme possible carboligase or decarboxylase [Enterovirga sp.]